MIEEDDEESIEKRDMIPRVYMTLEEVAEVLGMSRERVRQIEKEALSKLKKAFTSKGLTFEDLMPDASSCPDDDKTLIRKEDSAF